jgi:glycosyltransferase involved in cell wall biosynthesis
MRLASRILTYYSEELTQLPEALRARAVALDNSLDTATMFRLQSEIGSEETRRCRAEAGFRDDAPLLISVGRLTAKARVDLLLEALALCRSTGFVGKLAIIGDGPERGPLERQATTLGLKDSVLWLGAIWNEQEIAPWMMAANLFVYAGEIGLSMIHAFAYGLPVVMADGSRHNPEALLFRTGLHGVTFSSGDPASLSQVLLLELAHPEVLAQRGRSAQKMVRDRLSAESMADHFVHALSSVENGPEGSR